MKLFIFVFLFPVLAWSAQIDVLLSAFEAESYTSVSDEALRFLGEKVQDYVSDPKNQKHLSTAKGQELLKRQRKLANYFAIQQTFEKCVKASRRGLDKRILLAAKHSQLIEQECENYAQTLVPLKDLSQVIERIQQKAQYQNLDSLQGKIHLQSMKNAVSTYLTLKYKYEPNVSANTALDLCKDNRKKVICSNEQQQSLLKHAEAYLKELNESGETRLSFQEAAAEINGKIDTLNESLKSVPIDFKKNWYSNWAWDSSSPQFNNQSLQAFDQYVTQYLQIASSGSGLLLMTDAVRDKVGGLRKLEEAEKVSGTRGPQTRYTYTPHKKVDEKDVRKSVEEAKTKILEQAQNLNNLDSKRRGQSSGTDKTEKARLTDIKKIATANPVAIGQVLINQPENATSICRAINEIEDSDIRDERWNKGILWGSAIVGGVLVVTGIGSAAGAWLLAGTTAGATAAAVGTWTSMAGLAISMSETGRHAYAAAEARSAQRDFERAFLAGNGDARNIQDAQTALTEYNKTKMQAMVSLGMTLTNMGLLRNITKAAQYGVGVAAGLAEKSQFLKNTTQALKAILEDSKAVAQIKNLMAYMPQGRVSAFLGYTLQVTEELRIKVLEKLKNVSPESMKKIIDEALVLAQGCSIA